MTEKKKQIKSHGHVKCVVSYEIFLFVINHETLKICLFLFALQAPDFTACCACLVNSAFFCKYK